MSKAIFVFCDGTWNTPDQQDQGHESPTNVYKLFLNVLETSSQFRFYDAGVGTDGGLDSITGGAFGKGLFENIRQAYLFIVEHFQPGDRIFLFGFSRGAYTVRSLAGMIGALGIVREEHQNQVERAYRHYRQDYDNPDVLDLFAKQFSHRERSIEFVGVWDTVGALGIPLRSLNWLTASKYEFHNTKLGEHIRHAYHALAIDEKRRQFEPVLWQQRQLAPGQKVEQRWFIGAHSNVGGGYRDSRLSDISLNWMTQKLLQAEPKIALEQVPDAKTQHKGEIVESRSGLYLASWVAPELRKIFRPDIINESIDDSVLQRIQCSECDYQPSNVLQALEKGEVATQQQTVES